MFTKDKFHHQQGESGIRIKESGWIEFQAEVLHSNIILNSILMGRTDKRIQEL